MIKKASYIKLLENGDLLKKSEEIQRHIKDCNLCPHKCGVNREKETGICGAGSRAVVSSYGPHLGEEKVLVGSRGSGTIFFGHCNMSCVYCQNYQTSFYGEGRIVSNEELAEMMLALQNDYSCHNINLVTPTHYLANILEALYLAARKGLKIPLVYNTGGYESLEILKILDGAIDIYMPDFKYFSNDRARKYSKVEDYPKCVKKALKEMDRQVGGLKTKRGLAYRGVIIRHLILPGGLEDSKKILKFIKDNLSEDVLVNLMDQYYPSHRAFEYEEISTRLDLGDYREVYAYGKSLDLRLAER